MDETLRLLSFEKHPRIAPGWMRRRETKRNLLMQAATKVGIVAKPVQRRLAIGARLSKPPHECAREYLVKYLVSWRGCPNRPRSSVIVAEVSQCNIC